MIFGEANSTLRGSQNATRICDDQITEETRVEAVSLGGLVVTLPTFLGIGVPRAGTTWLHEVLASHPDVYVPTRRKEVRFFSQHYSQGIRWYEGFFPPAERAARYLAIGEVSPDYFYASDCPERISSVPSVAKLILLLRNPVDRAYSQYGLRVQIGKSSESFEAFLSLRPQAIEWGYYSRYLGSFWRYFEKSQILVLIFEQAVTDTLRTKEILADFLNVELDRFPPTAGERKANTHYVPKSRLTRYVIHRVGWEFMRYRWNLDWAVNLVGRLGIERLFGNAGSLPPMKRETRQYLVSLYENEVRELECLLQVDLTCWK
jgi:hypothetical protein